MRKKETITLSIPPGTKEQLEAIALHQEIFWGKDPSVSGLIVAMPQGGLPLAARPTRLGGGPAFHPKLRPG